jgi:hypothetical protein
MRIFMTGGTGFVGSALTQTLTQGGHRVTVLTRSVRPDRVLPQGAEFQEGDPTEPGAWQEQVPAHDAVVNLAGASIFTRWTRKAKETLRESRLRTTRNLVNALEESKGPPAVRFLSTSAVGYYGFCGDEDLTEESPPGGDFLARLTVDWENEARRAEETGASVALLRFGVVLGGGEGALSRMIPLFKKYLGSPLGSGAQWFSWIHVHDLVSIHRFLLEHPDIQGPVNCTAPNPVRNRELTKALADVLGKPAFLPPVPGFVLRTVMGEFGNVLLKGQRTLPERLTKEGFAFEYPDVRNALEDLLGSA